MIPYTVDRRADTGATNVTLGIWLFLASEVMLFGAMFSAYALLRVSAPAWPHGPDLLNWHLGAQNTVVLLIGTFGIWRARRTIGSARRSWLTLGIVGAIFFLTLKSTEYRAEIALGFVPSISTFAAMYFTLTGLHAVHVLGGLVANFWVMGNARSVGDAMTAGRLHALSLYWLFVDVVWLIIFVLVYLT